MPLCFTAIIGGTEGLFAQKTLEITYDLLSTYKNQGSVGPAHLSLVSYLS